MKLGERCCLYNFRLYWFISLDWDEKEKSEIERRKKKERKKEEGEGGEMREGD